MSFLNSKPVQDAVPQARHEADMLLQSANKAMDSTRDYANDVLDKAEHKVREFGHNIDPVGDMLAATAQKLARQSVDMATDAKDYAQHALNRATKVSSRYVADQPLQSVLMAAAVGAAVATLISYTRNRPHNRY